MQKKLYPSYYFFTLTLTLYAPEASFIPLQFRSISFVFHFAPFHFIELHSFHTPRFAPNLQEAQGRKSLPPLFSF
jgi:hypothetical protein